MKFQFNKTDIVSGFSKMYFEILLEIATKDILFQFDGKLYKQIEGLAMKITLGPTLANIFNCHKEFKPIHAFIQI